MFRRSVAATAAAFNATPSRFVSAGSGGGALRATASLLPWWNYSTEQRNRLVQLNGGAHADKTQNSFHRMYQKKFRKNAFPNRRRQQWNMCMHGLYRQRPLRLAWPYDITSMIFNSHRPGADKIGYVVNASYLKTAHVASNYLVYYPKYNQRVQRSGRYQAHDEDMACVEGDLVHIKMCRKISKYKHYYVFSILEPNIEGRERLKYGLPAVPPALFGYPNSRRIVKLNLTEEKANKQKLAAAIQEQVQDFYRFGGRVSEAAMAEARNRSGTFQDATAAIGENAPATPDEGMTTGEETPLLGGGDEGQYEPEVDERVKKGEDYYHKMRDDPQYHISNLGKSP